MISYDVNSFINDTPNQFTNSYRFCYGIPNLKAKSVILRGNYLLENNDVLISHGEHFGTGPTEPKTRQNG